MNESKIGRGKCGAAAKKSERTHVRCYAIGLAVLCAFAPLREASAQNAAVIGNAAYTNELVVATKPTKLYAVTGYNSGSAQFIQVFGTNAPPLNGATPVFSVPVASQQYFDLDFSYYGADLDAIVICNSSTANTLTLGSQNCGIQAIIRH